MKSNKVISPSGREFSAKLLKEELNWALKLERTESIWKPKDAIVEKNGDQLGCIPGKLLTKKKLI